MSADRKGTLPCWVAADNAQKHLDEREISNICQEGLGTCGACRQEQGRADQGQVCWRQPCPQACTWPELETGPQCERSGLPWPAGWLPPCCLSKGTAQGRGPSPGRVMKAGKRAYPPVHWHLAADTCMEQHSRQMPKKSSCSALGRQHGWQMLSLRKSLAGEYSCESAQLAGHS